MPMVNSGGHIRMVSNSGGHVRMVSNRRSCQDGQ